MKLKHLIGTFVLAGVLAVGATTLTANAFSSNEAKSVEAATTTKRIFLDCTQYADYDNAQSIGIQYYVSNYVKIEATKDADNYWHVDVPYNVTKVQFFRCDTGNVGKNYNWQWEGDGSVNYYSVKGWNNDGDWSSANGADETYTIASTTPSETTKRIWVDPKSNFYDANARAALRVFNGTNHVITYILGGSSQYASVGSEAYIFYVDINVNYDCQLVRLHNVFNIVWSYGHNISTMDGYNTTKIVYQWNANIANDYSCGNESDPNVDYAKKVLDGYSTCVESDVNGYLAYSNINTNILSKLTSAELSELRSSTFDSGKYGIKTYGDKIDLMVNPRSPVLRIDSVFAGNNQTTPIIVIVIVSLVAVTTIGGYFYLRHKKEQ